MAAQPFDDLRPRLITAAEAAELLEVAEADVLEWVRNGTLAADDTIEGEPRFQILQSPELTDGPTRSGVVMHNLSPGEAELARRRRAHRLTSLDRAGHAGVDLAAGLAARVGPHLPPGLQTEADEGRFSVRAADGSSGGTDIAWMLTANPRPWTELIEGVIERALNAAQDKVAEVTAEPWPGRGAALPPPWARVEGDVVRLGYGEPDAPVLELEPLALAPLRQP